MIACTVVEIFSIIILFMLFCVKAQRRERGREGRERGGKGERERGKGRERGREGREREVMYVHINVLVEREYFHS